MTIQITRYGGTIHEAGMDTRYEFGPKAGGEYVKYDDIKHLLLAELSAREPKVGNRVRAYCLTDEGERIAREGIVSNIHPIMVDLHAQVGRWFVEEVL
jgi:hypothetical protein